MQARMSEICPSSGLYAHRPCSAATSRRNLGRDPARRLDYTRAGGRNCREAASNRGKAGPRLRRPSRSRCYTCRQRQRSSGLWQRLPCYPGVCQESLSQTNNTRNYSLVARVARTAKSNGPFNPTFSEHTAVMAVLYVNRLWLVRRGRTAIEAQ